MCSSDLALAAELRHIHHQGSELLTALRPQLQQLEPGANVQWLEAPGGRPPAGALDRLREHQQRLAALAKERQCEALLAELERLILLSPIRQGPWGVEGVQRALLGDALAGPLQRWPLGTPVLCQRNLADLGLANGDVGLVVSVQGQRRLLFGTPGSPEPLLIHPEIGRAHV